jgi:hypothetical protein
MNFIAGFEVLAVVVMKSKSVEYDWTIWRYIPENKNLNKSCMFQKSV